MLDPVRNFAKTTVLTGHSAADTSVALSSGGASRFPNPATDGRFNLVWWNQTDYPDPSDDPNVEIVRVTAEVGDTLTILRAQEGTSASSKNTIGKTYAMMLAPTRKTIEDIEDNILGAAFNTERPSGVINDSNRDFMFSAKPKAIVINGSMYLNTSKIAGSFAWVWSDPIATIAFAPGDADGNGDLFGIM